MLQYLHQKGLNTVD